ncbi:MAG: TetR/AcrR family transcriptional regulator [Planctomycetes bacterium]|nr:TetR/AcrR family transcriptional regulator [Planctomycetota bacterium]
MKHAPTRLDRAARSRQIVIAATPLFARLGFHGTTTRQIAKIARVNEALIFRYFPKKEDLYWSVLETQCEAVGARTKLQKTLSSAGGEEAALAALARDILERNMRDSTLSRLLFFCALERHELAARFFNTVGEGYVDDLAKYIERGGRAGVFRVRDSKTAARAFIGMVFHHFIVYELFGGNRRGHLDIPKVAEALTSLWLDGMRKTDKSPVKRYNKNKI